MMRLRRVLRDGRQAGFLALGGLMLALGVIGAFLPVMPTTIFLILAAWCFGRSSPRLEAWMLDHPRFGRPLRQWREQGAVPLRAKLMAVSGMALGYTLFWFGSQHTPLIAGMVALFMIAAAIYVVSRPEPDLRNAVRDSDAPGGLN
ncbi:YbaN family protein [Pseudorhodoplanes sp.]|uniref:YbaN family protein n=1 Tax=Pseudorhodoplanes sp. TaxID=1934341 RepID=UPI003D0BAB71